MALNRYTYANQNPVNMVDPSGLQCTYMTVGMAGCTYERELAAKYAVLWGITNNVNGANNSSQARGLNIGAGTDCANFASQVLEAGGFMQTTNWGYEPGGNPGYIVPAHGSPWQYVPALLDFLTGQSVAGDHTPPGIKPKAIYSPSRDDLLTVDKKRTYSDYQNDTPLGLLERGDLIFYIVPGKYGSTGLDSYDHVAVIIGWGCPENGCEQNVQPPSEPGYEPESRHGLVPWIIDHGVKLANTTLMGKTHPYDQWYGAYHHVIFGFTHIPDTFIMSNVKPPAYLIC